MAGPGVGNARITVDIGNGYPRFVARVQTGSRPATAATLLEALPGLTAAIERELEVAAAREQGEPSRVTRV
jgi:hypothetical protein